MSFSIIVIYVTVLLGLGFLFRSNNPDDYFTGGKRMPFGAVGLSIVATMLSTITYLAEPGEVIKHGLAFAIGSWIAIPIAFVITHYFCVPFVMKNGNISIYEYLERRYGPSARLLGAYLFIYCLRLWWMAVIVLTASRAIAEITGDDELFVLCLVGTISAIYTSMGGIRAVIWSDVIQFGILFIGLLLTLGTIAYRTETGPIDWFQSSTHRGFPPFFTFDLTTRNVILFTTLNGIFWYVCTFTADQVAVQRYLSTSSVSEARKSNAIGFIAGAAVKVLMALCGMALLVYYSDAKGDEAFPRFIANDLPPLASSLLTVALFAVAMSSIDSGVNSVATVYSKDVLKTDNVGTVRMAAILVGGASVLIAASLRPYEYNIIGLASRTFNCALGPLAAMFFLSPTKVKESQVIVAVFVGFSTGVAIAWLVNPFLSIPGSVAVTVVTALLLSMRNGSESVGR